MELGFEVVNLHGTASGVIATPVIGTNGNWFVGNKDTGVAAKGETGEQGPKGEKGDQGEIGPAGPQGIQGIQGEKGDKGDQGIQGETGDQGDKGDQGIQGEKGDQGIQGIQGEKGDQGELGPVGPQGIQGEKGDQGIQGEKGDQGEKGTDADPAELKRLSGEIDTLEENFGTFKKNFQDGCSKIASAITAQGVTTASNASPTTMATNIATIATNKYNAGYNAGTASGYNVAYVGRVTGAYNNHAITSYGGTVYTDLNVAEIYLKIVSSYAHASHDNDSFDAGMSPVATKNGTAITVTGCGVNSNNRLFCWCSVDVYVKYKL